MFPLDSLSLLSALERPILGQLSAMYGFSHPSRLQRDLDRRYRTTFRNSHESTQFHRALARRRERASINNLGSRLVLVLEIAMPIPFLFPTTLRIDIAISFLPP